MKLFNMFWEAVPEPWPTLFQTRWRQCCAFGNNVEHSTDWDNTKQNRFKNRPNLLTVNTFFVSVNNTYYRLLLGSLLQEVRESSICFQFNVLRTNPLWNLTIT